MNEPTHDSDQRPAMSAWPLSKGIPPCELIRMASFTGLARPHDYYNQELEDDSDDDDSYPHRL